MRVRPTVIGLRIRRGPPMPRTSGTSYFRLWGRRSFRSSFHCVTSCTAVQIRHDSSFVLFLAQAMTLLTSEGRDSEGPKSWEPEGLELPLILPVVVPARKAPP